MDILITELVCCRQDRIIQQLRLNVRGILWQSARESWRGENIYSILCPLRLIKVCCDYLWGACQGNGEYLDNETVEGSCLS